MNHNHTAWTPVEQCSNIICGVIMAGMAVAVLIRIHTRKNNQFAYILLSFTVLLGAAYIGKGVTECLRKPRKYSGDVKLPNMYAKNFFLFLLPVTALQGWIFAIRYWQSATMLSAYQ